MGSERPRERSVTAPEHPTGHQPATVLLWTVVGFAAAIGALARWALGETWPSNASWPWPLWWINVAGAAALGLVTGWSVVRARPLLAAALGPGLLGGFTSVSAAADDVRALLSNGSVLTAAAWWGSMLLVSVLGVITGRRLAGALESEPQC